MLKMKIKTNNKGVQILFKEQTKDFTFESIDWLIDEFMKASKDEKLDVEIENDDLENYKKLIDEIFGETQKEDFRKTYDALNVPGLSNEDIVELLSAEPNSSVFDK